MLRTLPTFLLTLLALGLVFAGDAHAGEGFSLSRYLASFATRTRVIQLAAVGMLIALVIIMKKFDEPRD